MHTKLSDMVASFSQEALGNFAEFRKVYQANFRDPLVRRAASMSHALNRVFVSASLLIAFLDPDDFNWVGQLRDFFGRAATANWLTLKGDERGTKKADLKCSRRRKTVGRYIW
jgi:hypothetical protein